MPVIIDLGLNNHYFDSIDYIAQIRLRLIVQNSLLFLISFGSNEIFSVSGFALAEKINQLSLSNDYSGLDLQSQAHNYHYHICTVDNKNVLYGMNVAFVNDHLIVCLVRGLGVNDLDLA